jgi:hypothetical protein
MGRRGHALLAALASVAAVVGLVVLASAAGASPPRTAFGPNASGGFGRQAGARFGHLGLNGRWQPGSADLAAPGAFGSSVPSPGKNGELTGVVCVDASDCWAVGSYENSSDAYLNEVLHFNGKKWSVVKTPDPAGKGSDDDNELYRLKCLSASSCWAVGETEKGNDGADLNEALHFNGKKWSSVRTPDPAGRGSHDFNELEGVACAKPTDCWAVGETEKSNDGADLNEALHFNGKKWSSVRTPDPAGKVSHDFNELEGLSCVGASDCWSVGESERDDKAELNEALHFNGKMWSVVKTPDPAGSSSTGEFNELERVACAKPSDCWAVGGTRTSSADDNEALHWDGKKWSHVSTPQPATTPSEFGSPLVSVSCTSAASCWAVGYYENSAETAIVGQAQRWNGKKWSHVTTPQPGGNPGVDGLFAVTCARASDCLAAGTAGPSLTDLSNLVQRWNGKRWKTF